MSLKCIDTLDDAMVERENIGLYGMNQQSLDIYIPSR